MEWTPGGVAPALCACVRQQFLLRVTLRACGGRPGNEATYVSCHKDSLLHASLSFQTYLNNIIINIIIDVKNTRRCYYIL